MFSDDMFSRCVHKASSQPRAGEFQGVENTMMNITMATRFIKKYNLIFKKSENAL